MQNNSSKFKTYIQKNFFSLFAFRSSLQRGFTPTPTMVSRFLCLCTKQINTVRLAYAKLFSLVSRNRMTHRPQLVSGFTLVEMIVAVSVFVVVMVSGIGALVSMIDANRKAQSLRIVMDNLNFALENMTRNMRVGVDYHCGSIGNLNTPRDCAVDGDSFIAFTDSDGDRIIFRLNGGRIEKSEDLGSSFLGITAPEITVEELKFFVKGSLEGDGLQPKVLVIVRGVAGGMQKTSTTFSLQTFASQRLRDS